MIFCWGFVPFIERGVYICAFVANNDCLQTVPTILNGENMREEAPDKKSKERREKDRKALRMRRINSLKRQISIKEKMLEVGARDTNYVTKLLSLWNNNNLTSFLNIAYA